MKSVIDAHAFLADADCFMHRGVSLWRSIVPKLAGYNGLLLQWFLKIKPLLDDGETRETVYGKILGSVETMHAFYGSRYGSAHYVPDEISLPPSACRKKFRRLEIPMGAHLFFASLDNYSSPMMPVMRRLAEAGEPVLFITHRGHRSMPPERVSIAGVVSVAVEDLIDHFDLCRRYDRYVLEVPGTWEAVAALLRDGLAGPPGLLFKYFEPAYRHVLGRYLPMARVLADVMGHLAGSCRVRLLWMARLRRSAENAMHAAAVRSTVPSVMLMHGSFGPIINEQIYNAMGFLDADLTLVWNAPQRDFLIENVYAPVPAERIAVAGNPEWEMMKKRFSCGVPLSRDRVMKRLGIETSRYVVLTEGTISKAQIEKIAACFHPLGDISLVVKLHPDASNCGKQALEDNARVVLLSHESAAVDLHSLIYHADMTMACFSTTLFESVALGTPVAVLDFLSGGWSRFPFETYGMPVCRNVEELARLLLEIDKEPDYKRRFNAFHTREYERFNCEMTNNCAVRITTAVQARFCSTARERCYAASE